MNYSFTCSWPRYEASSLVTRPPVFDRLQYANTEGARSQACANSERTSPSVLAHMYCKRSKTRGGEGLAWEGSYFQRQY